MRGIVGFVFVEPPQNAQGVGPVPPSNPYRRLSAYFGVLDIFERVLFFQ